MSTKETFHKPFERVFSLDELFMYSFEKTCNTIMSILVERQSDCIIYDVVTPATTAALKESRFNNNLSDNHHFSIRKKVRNHLTLLQASKETFEMFHSGHCDG